MRGVLLIGAALLVTTGCPGEDRCGPTRARVTRVVDGDTIELESGERIRYLGVDTPETTNGSDDCYGAEAVAFNQMLVEGKNVDIRYDVECTDRFDRLLAYVSVDDQEVNRSLVGGGYACALFIAPNGADREAEFESLQRQAQQQMLGMWGACTAEEIVCDN